MSPGHNLTAAKSLQHSNELYLSNINDNCTGLGASRGCCFSLLFVLGLFELVDSNLQLICAPNRSHGVVVNPKNKA
ncbi:unnamed protein product [Musa acuminata subsp. malaccensis]|uniref:(wild Malaysian banana) hypothetical protein n=1 Tax=Musa acuminata subsp. malaccensis TaxID=214687 RepID=A0A8D7FK65_MUSAM|nr:unnamed protein product [Musa acuminata subsp. malaccensis]